MSQRECPEMPPIIRAAYRRDLRSLRAALAEGAPVDSQTSRGDTALIAAAGWGAIDLVEELLAAGGDVTRANRFGETPLILADAFERKRVGERLRAAGLQPDAEGVAALKARREELEPALRSLERLQSLLDDQAVDVNLPIAWPTPLTRAVERSTPATVRALLEAGALVDLANGYQKTPLGMAAEVDSEEMARLLLEAGADPEEPLGQSSRSPRLGSDDELQLAGARRLRRFFDAAPPKPWRPLHHAALHDAASVTRLLLDAGADLHAEVHSRETALHLAAKAKGEEALRVLLEAGADIERRSVDGTPLRCAAERGKVASVRLLLEWGADVSQRSGRGDWTPLEAAQKCGHGEVVQLLLEAGAGAEPPDDVDEPPEDLVDRSGRSEPSGKPRATKKLGRRTVDGKDEGQVRRGGGDLP